MHGRELDDVETVGQDTIGLALEQMFGLVCGDVGDCGEDIAGVCGGTLNTVPVVDTTLSCLGVHIEVLEVVVEIYGAGAKVTSEKGCVGGEDSGYIDASLAAEWERHTGEPLVEMRDDGLGRLVANEL